MTNEIIAKARMITGWTEDKVIQEFTGLECSPTAAINWFAVFGEAPGVIDQIMIKNPEEFDFWVRLTQKGRRVKEERAEIPAKVR